MNIHKPLAIKYLKITKNIFRTMFVWENVVFMIIHLLLELKKNHCITDCPLNCIFVQTGNPYSIIYKNWNTLWGWVEMYWMTLGTLTMEELDSPSHIKKLNWSLLSLPFKFSLSLMIRLFIQNGHVTFRSVSLVATTIIHAFSFLDILICWRDWSYPHESDPAT